MNSMKPPSAFRLWINNIWMDNCEERICWGESILTSAEYFNKFKWMLKREFKHHQNKKDTSP